MPKYSIVVPFHNEEESVTALYDQLKAVMEQVGDSFELIFVDDGSRDRTFRLLSEVAAVDSRVLVIKLRRNFGQTSALAAGFDHAEGDFILAMDGDLQHDPQEIPKFLEKLEEGYDVVSGWREQRVDNLVMRRIPSRVANWLMAKLSGVEIHDFGTTYKAYRREVIQAIPLYGEMHRFIPALATWYGASICEIPIKNIERPKGKSHYGISRTFRVLFDLMTIRFLLRYMTRPAFFWTPRSYQHLERCPAERLAAGAEDIHSSGGDGSARPDLCHRGSVLASRNSATGRGAARRIAGASLPCAAVATGDLCS
jgi:glycosyltransferase involved in cell wall biosynthesis